MTAPRPVRPLAVFLFRADAEKEAAWLADRHGSAMSVCLDCSTNEVGVFRAKDRPPKRYMRLCYVNPSARDERY